MPVPIRIRAKERDDLDRMPISHLAAPLIATFGAYFFSLVNFKMSAMWFGFEGVNGGIFAVWDLGVTHWAWASLPVIFAYGGGKSWVEAKNLRNRRREQLGELNMRYTVIIERGETGWGAHVPDLPGCIAAAESRKEVLQLIREAMELHVQGLKEEGLAIPKPRSNSETIEIGAA